MKRLSIILIMLVLLAFTTPAALASDKYDLSNFGWRYVDSKGRGSLVFQKAPRGKSMKGHKFYTGDQIYVNLKYRENGYGIAYENGEYGYVDASYINWGGSNTSSSPASSSKSSGSMSSSDKDLSYFEYRRVASNGRGSLVFQKSPRGKSMKGHKFYDGDWIYVNVNYRKDSYSIAYENGEYGFVDASYIDWGSRKPSGKGSSSGSHSNSSSTDGSGIVSFSGNVNIRSGPGLDYAVIGSVSQGQTLSYAGDKQDDNRGVTWYSVFFNGEIGWASSKYSSLKGGTSSNSGSDSGSIYNTIELSGYYGKSISETANALGGGFSIIQEDGEDNIYVTYKKNGLSMTGDINLNVGSIGISSGIKYSLLGITIGMSKSDAQAILKKYTREVNSDDWEEYVIQGTIYNRSIVFYIEYSGNRVSSIAYGLWS